LAAVSATRFRKLRVFGSALVFIDALMFTVLAPLLPHLASDLALSKAQAGILSAAYPAGALVAALPAGLLANRLGPRITIQLGLLSAAAGCFLMTQGGSAAIFDIARFVQGVGATLSWSGALTWLIAAAPPEKRGKVVGTVIGTGLAGALLGPVLGALAVGVGIGPVFAVTGLVALALAWAAFRFEEVRVSDTQTVREILNFARSRRVAAAVCFAAVPGLAFGVLVVLAPLRMSALGAGAAAIAAVFILSAGVEALAAPLAGTWGDRRTSRVPFAAGLMICAGALALMAWADSLTILLPAVLVASVGGGFCLTPAITMLSEAAEAKNLHQGVAVGLANFAWSLGQALGAIGGGALAGFGGNAVPLLAMVVLLGLTAVYARGPHVAYS
jgi:MFS family permease